MGRMRRTKIEQSVVLDVQRALEARLMDGSWGAGTCLPAERRLAEMLGVSQNTVREA
ncbi:MAG: Bacterial regulatory protein gntR family, partial [Pseudomonadota bacterium]|nr:Bacterial regulatory protein gntR family [Pseudomonadota bacterium]